MTKQTDKAAMALGGGLILLGIVGLGLVEMLAGAPYGAAPVLNEAGEVVATPMVDPTIRTGLVLAGLAVLALNGVYKAVTADDPTEQTVGAETIAD